MIQALNMQPYSSSKRDEIMSRYRPIAPKPDCSTPNPINNNIDAAPEKFRQSPYLRDIWSHLQARPTRTRKRGRTPAISPAAAAAMLRNQQQQQQMLQQGAAAFMPSHASNNLTLHALGNTTIYTHDLQHSHLHHHQHYNNHLIELPLLSPAKGKPIDLNSIDHDEEEVTGFDQEKDDLSLKLQIIPSITNKSSNNNNNNVISPRPVRPVGSIISIVGPMDPTAGAVGMRKSWEKMEEEAEGEVLPAVITDGGKKVRMVNSAYKELVGQPECPWLSRWSGSSRISGEVMIRSPAGAGVGKGFSCWVRIEWERSDNGGKQKKYVNAFSEVVRLECETSKEYVLYWKFHTREVSPSASNNV